MAVTSNKSKVHVVYTTASFSFQFNSAEEVRNKPEIFGFRDTNRRSQPAYTCAIACAAAAWFSPKTAVASAVYVASRGKGSPPRFALLSPRQDIWRKAFDTSLASQRFAVMHHQMHNHSSVFHRFSLQGMIASVPLSISGQVSLIPLSPDWHGLSNAGQLSSGSVQRDLLFSCGLWIWIALRIPGKSWHSHLKSCLFPVCSLNRTQPL